MNKNERDDLSPRYYTAEFTGWLLGGILVVSRFLGAAPDQPLPILNVQLADNLHYVRVVAFLLIGASLYLVVEWKQSSKAARDAPLSFARLTVTVCWAIGALWVSHPVVWQDTEFAGISPAWHLAFLAVGLVLGFCIAILAFAVLMIRSKERSQRLCLPRVPVASRAQLTIGTPIVILLFGINYALLLFAPPQVGAISGFLVIIPFLLIILAECVSLCFARDENGNRVPYAKHVEKLRKAFDFHDYAYFLNNQGDEAIKEIGINTNALPQAIQQDIKKYFASQAQASTTVTNALKEESEHLLHWLVTSGQEVAVAEAIKNGADVNERAEFGWTPLLHASAQGYPCIARILLNAGANPDIGNVNGITPLMYSAKYGNAEVCQILLEYGAAVDIQDIYSMTALIVASKNGHLNIVKHLLAAGADPNVMTRDGKKAVDFAYSCGHGKTARLLKTANKPLAT